MSAFGYQRALQKYEDVDEDTLLATLSHEELQELERELDDLDPDRRVPIGLRQRDHTARTPAGGGSGGREDEREEEEAKPGREADKSSGGRVKACDDNKSPDGLRTLDNDRKKVSPKGKKAQIIGGKNHAKKDETEKRDECKREAPVWSRCPEKNGPSRTNTTEQDPPERASGNPTVIEDALDRIRRDDPAMNEVNLNNIEDVSQETLLRFAEALTTNTHVAVFSLANTHADDRVAFAISKMLRENRSVRNLNVESNFLSGRGIMALVAALQHNRTLVELRFQNQRHICGGKVEMEMVQLLRENTTLLKLGYQFDLPGPRMTATGILTRNQDQQRQRRLQQKKEQGLPEGSGQVPGPPVEKKPQKKSLQTPKAAENQNKPSQDTPAKRIAETVNGTRGQSNRGKPRSRKQLKNGANEKESVDILKELQHALKPSLQKRRDEALHPPPPPQKSSHDDLMAAIRGSSIGALKRVETQT